MPQAANSFATFNSTRNRELLMDKIYNVSIKDTPFLTMLERESIDAVNPRWHNDVFAPSAVNRAEQGNIPIITATTPTVEYNNRTQILEKTFAITRTQQKNRKAGPGDEKYEASKRMVELKKDIEFAFLQNTTAIPAITGVGGQTRGMLGWVAANASFGVGGVNPNPITNVAPTDGTTRPFTEALFRDTIRLMYDNGADIEGCYALIPSSQRTAFDGFLAGQTRFDKAEDTTLHALLEVYIGPFGRIKAVNARNMRQREVFIVNPDFVKHGVFDEIDYKQLAIRGDAKDFLVNTECALMPTNEKAHGVVRDLV